MQSINMTRSILKLTLIVTEIVKIIFCDNALYSCLASPLSHKLRYKNEI